MPIDQSFALRKFHDLSDRVADDNSDSDTECNFIEPGDVEPFTNSVTIIVVDDEIKSQVYQRDELA